MPEKTPEGNRYFNYNGQDITIPINSVDKFIKDYPDAQEVGLFNIGGKEPAVIPFGSITKFVTENPTVKPLYESDLSYYTEVAAKQATGTYDYMMDAAKQGAKISTEEQANPTLTPEEKQLREYFHPEEAQSDLNSSLRNIPPVMLKSVGEHAKALINKIADPLPVETKAIINMFGGDTPDAKQIVAPATDYIGKWNDYFSSEVAYNNSQMSDNKASNFVAGLVPSAIQMAAVVAMPSLAPAYVGGMYLQESGGAMVGYEETQKKLGRPVNEEVRLGVGIVYGGIAAAAEQLGTATRLTKGIFTGAAKKRVLESAIANPEQMAKIFRDFVAKNPSKGKMLWELSKKAAKDGNWEGIEEGITTLLQAGTGKLTYDDNAFDGIVENTVMSYAGGFALGSIFAGASARAYKNSVQQAMDSEGSAKFGVTKEGKVVQVFNQDKGVIYGINETGNLSEKSAKEIDYLVDISKEDYDNFKGLSEKNGSPITENTGQQAPENPLQPTIDRINPVINDNGTHVITQLGTDQKPYFIKSKASFKEDGTLDIEKLVIQHENPTTPVLIMDENGKLVDAKLHDFGDGAFDISAWEAQPAEQILAEQAQQIQAQTEQQAVIDMQNAGQQPVMDETGQPTGEVAPIPQEITIGKSKFMFTENEDGTDTYDLSQSKSPEKDIKTIMDEVEPEGYTVTPITEKRTIAAVNKYKQPTIQDVIVGAAVSKNEVTTVEPALIPEVKSEIPINQTNTAPVSTPVQELSTPVQQPAQTLTPAELDAIKALENGERVFIQEEITGKPQEMKSVEDITTATTHGYTQFEVMPVQPESNIPTWHEAFNKAKEDNDIIGIEELYNKIKVVQNGVLQGRIKDPAVLEDTINELNALKKEIEVFAEEWKRNNAVTAEILSQQPNLNPTDGQKEAGNYKKAHVIIQGMDISIENPIGSTRSGKDEDGKVWEHVMKSHYGYFKQTEGKDGDHIDTFIGPNPESPTVYVIDQVFTNGKNNGLFDESKVMLGYNSQLEAENAYMENYDPDWMGLSDITAVPVEQFKEWLYDGAKQRKPFADYKDTQNIYEETNEDTAVEDQKELPTLDTFAELAYKSKGWDEFRRRLTQSMWGLDKPTLERLFPEIKEPGVDVGGILKQHFVDEATRWQSIKEEENKQVQQSIAEQNVDNIVALAEEASSKMDETLMPTYKTGDQVTYNGEPAFISGVSTDLATGEKTYDIEINGKTIEDLELYELNLENKSPLEWAKDNRERLIQKYIDKNGLTIDPDDIRHSFKHLGYDGANVQPYREADIYLSDQIYSELLKRNPDAPVLFLTGIPGAGKGTVTRNDPTIKEGKITFDAAFSDNSRMIDAINKAEGHDIVVTTVHRDVVESFLGTVKRSIDTGNRSIPIDYYLKSVTAIKNRLSDLSDLDNEVVFTNFANKGGIYSAISDYGSGINYETNYDELKSALDNSEYYNKLIDEQYERITGTKKESPSIKVDTGEAAKTERGTGSNGESSQRVLESTGLAGITPNANTEQINPTEMTLVEFSDAVYNGDYDFTPVDYNKHSIKQRVENYNNSEDPQNKQIAKEHIDKAIESYYNTFKFLDSGRNKKQQETKPQFAGDILNEVKGLAKKDVPLHDKNTQDNGNDNGLSQGKTGTHVGNETGPTENVGEGRSSVPEGNSATQRTKSAGNDQALPEGNGPELNGDNGNDTQLPSTSGRVTRGVGERTDGTGTGPDNGAVRPVRNSNNLVIAEGDVIVPRGDAAKIKANIEAIRIAKRLEHLGQKASPAQMAALKKYTGWGGLAAVFKYDNANYTDLKTLLSESEYKSARESTTTAFFTPIDLVHNVWKAIERLGFKGGNVLEPSAGIGHFFGTAPQGIRESSNFTGIELDQVSGLIMKALYPDAKTNIEGFEDIQINNNSLDLVITNVPFGTFKLHDSNEKDLSSRFNIHDFFIAKSVRKLKPGGLGVFITTTSTLDRGEDLRRWLANEGNADVIDAFRLNTDTFKASSGTEASSDIIIIRKRDESGKSPYAKNVLDASVVRQANYQYQKDRYTYPETRVATMYFNKFFVDNPDKIAGEMKFGFEGGNDLRPTEQRVAPVKSKNQDELLQKFIEQLPADISQKSGATEVSDVETPDSANEGELIVIDGMPYIVVNGEAVAPDWNANKVQGYPKAEAVTGYAAIKNAINDLVIAESTNAPDIEPKRKALNKAYDGFVKKFGTLNNNTSITFLKDDINYPSVSAIENVDENKSVAPNGKKSERFIVSKSDIFSKRVIGGDMIARAETIDDAISVSKYKFGGLKPAFAAELLGMTEDEFTKQVVAQGKGFINPATGIVEPKEEYLSGNVVAKLQAAEQANDEGLYTNNISELKLVVPNPIALPGIKLTLGSSWIPTHVYDKFFSEVFGVDAKINKTQGGKFTAKISYENTELNKSKGMTEAYASKLALNAMNNTATIIMTSEYDPISRQYKQVKDHVATMQASTKQTELSEGFEAWVKKDGTPYAPELEKIYNETFNAVIEPKVDAQSIDKFPGASGKVSAVKDLDGETPTFKVNRISELSDSENKILFDTANKYGGLYDELGKAFIFADKVIANQFVKDINGNAKLLRTHQKEGVLRSLLSATMLAHEVGTGKTLVLITAAMEMRRLGLAKKPVIVVQRSTYKQFVNEIKSLYPGAKVLVPNSNDLKASQREQLFSKIAYNDWDIVVLYHSYLDSIPDDPSRVAAYIQEKINEKIEQLDEIRNSDDKNAKRMAYGIEKEIEGLRNSQNAAVNESIAAGKKKDANIKQAEKSKKNAETKAKQLVDRRTDNVLFFEQLGIDALLIDEAHAYKKLGFVTNLKGVKGVDQTASKRAQSLRLKTRYILDAHNGKNVVLATGTPISNTMAEMWTFLRYLLPKTELDRLQMNNFDAFVNNFGDIEESAEFNTSGKFKVTNRFSSYSNIPELQAIWKQVAHTVLTEEIGSLRAGVGTPNLAGGKPTDTYLPQTLPLKQVMRGIKERIEQFEKMTGKEKKENSHIPLVQFGLAKQAAIDVRLVISDMPDDPGSKLNEAVRITLKALDNTKAYNGTVAIFCDSFQNRDRKFNVFYDIKKKLVAAGIPENQIAVVNEYKTDDKKERLFKAINTGDVRVVLGSTEKLGVGVNMQERLNTLIHMDAPIRPSDYQQRNGRILRQGNSHLDMNIPVNVIRIGVEKTLDVTGYQRLEIKEKFIKQIMKSNSSDRSIQEVEVDYVDASNFSHMMASLSGSQAALALTLEQNKLRKLQNAETYHHQNQSGIAGKIHSLRSDIVLFEKWIVNAVDELKLLRSTFPTDHITDIAIGKKTVTSPEEFTTLLSDTYSSKIEEIKKELREDPRGEKRDVEFKIKVNGVQVTINVTLDKKVNTEQKKIRIETHITASSPFDNGYTSSIDTVIRNIENILSGVSHSSRAESYRKTINSDKIQLEQLQKELGQPFPKKEQLLQAEESIGRLEAQMRVELKDIEDQEKADNVKAAKIDESGLVDDSDTPDKPDDEPILAHTSPFAGDVLTESILAHSLRHLSTIPFAQRHNIVTIQANHVMNQMRTKTPMLVLQGSNDVHQWYADNNATDKHMVKINRALADPYMESFFDTAYNHVVILSSKVPSLKKVKDIVTHEAVHATNKGILGAKRVDILQYFHDVYGFDRVDAMLTSGYNDYTEPDRADEVIAFTVQDMINNDKPPTAKPLTYGEILDIVKGNQKIDNFTERLLSTVYYGTVNKTYRGPNGKGLLKPNSGTVEGVRPDTQAEPNTGRVGVQGAAVEARPRFAGELLGEGSINLLKHSSGGNNNIPPSVNPDVDAEMQAARGLNTETFAEKVARWKEEIKASTRHFEHIREQDFPAVYNKLRIFEAIPDAVRMGALETMKDILAPISKDKTLFAAFERSVILNDLNEDIQSGLYADKELPWGYNSGDEVQTDVDNINAFVKANPAVKISMNRRSNLMMGIRSKLIKQGLLDPKTENHKAYFHHQVLEFMNDRFKGVGVSSQDVRNHGKGWQKSRTGSMKAYNTNYLESEFEVLSQSLQQIEIKDILQQIGKEANIAPALMQTAEATGEDWRDLIPESFTTWYPKKGTKPWFAASFAEKAIDAAIQNPGDAALLERMVAEVNNHLWVIPQELANQLDSMKNAEEEKWFVRGLRTVNSAWKQWILINPFRVVKYNLNNMSGDMDIVLASNPDILKPEYSHTAAKELYAHLKGGKMSPDMREALYHGIITSGLSIQEIPDIGVQSAFKTLVETDENLAMKGIRKYWNKTKDYTQFRENMLRVAAYKYFKDKIGKGEIMYGASSKKSIDAISDPNEKAAKIARELIGDYGNLSQGGQWLRSHVYPFWSWVEINSPRYYRLLKNTPNEGGSTGPKVAGAIAGKTALNVGKLALKASLLMMLINMWNKIMFPDEDDELRKYNNQQLKLILGKDEHGVIRTLRVSGAFGDMLAWVGMENAPSTIQDLSSGKVTPKKKLNETGVDFINKLTQGAMPIEKTAAEVLLGKSLYPDITNPRAIRDRGEHALKMVSMDKVYRMLTKKPLKGIGAETSGLILYNVDPGEAAYYAIRQNAFDFNKENEIESYSSDPTDRSNALYYYKQSLKYGDTKLAAHWMEEYRKLGGTRKAIQSSIEKGEPRNAVKKELRMKWIKSLDTEEQEVLKMANKWYNETYR